MALVWGIARAEPLGYIRSIKRGCHFQRAGYIRSWSRAASGEIIVLSETHDEGAGHGQEASHGANASRSTPRRLVLITIIMLGFAALTFLPALFSRGGTGITSTGTNITEIFIPIWITLTISTVVISMWFARFLMTAEKYRDSETAPQGAPAHSH
jgi:hypothetical protein